MNTYHLIYAHPAHWHPVYWHPVYWHPVRPWHYHCLWGFHGGFGHGAGLLFGLVLFGIVAAVIVALVARSDKKQ
jgi:hypothetical protein